MPGSPWVALVPREQQGAVAAALRVAGMQLRKVRPALQGRAEAPLRAGLLRRRLQRHPVVIEKIQLQFRMALRTLPHREVRVVRAQVVQVQAAPEVPAVAEAGEVARQPVVVAAGQPILGGFDRFLLARGRTICLSWPRC